MRSRPRERLDDTVKIIIVGDGKVGFTLAEHLSQEDHDITVIDSDDDALRKAAEALDVLCVKGNGASISALRDSGAEQADVLIAATSMDEVNMISCLTAKRLGAACAIARVRNVEYTKELPLLQKELEIDLFINPERETAGEIARLLRFPAAARLETFGNGQVELVGFRLQKDDFLCGKPLAQMDPKVRALPLLFCAAEREDKVLIPNGAFIPEEDDTLYAIGQPHTVHQFFKVLGRYSARIKDVIIIGGGRISHYLATMLDNLGMHVKIIERDEARCRTLSEMLPFATVICGDGTDQDLLASEDLDASDACITRPGRDEDNLIMGLYALLKQVPKVIAKSNRDTYATIAREAGLDSVVSPKRITAYQIIHVVRGMDNSKGSVMNAMYKIADGRAEAMEFVANDTTDNLGVPLKDLHLKKQVLIATIIHRGKVIIPEGTSVISAGDKVIVIARDPSILTLNDIFEDVFSAVREALQ